MRKLLVSNLVSLDGYITGPDGNLMAMPFDESFSERNVELLRDVSVRIHPLTDTDVVAMRRSLLTQLGVTEEREEWPESMDDPRAPGFVVYQYLTYLQGEIIEVLASA